MLSLTKATKAKMLNVIVLSQKNRQPDDDPGAKLSVETQLPAAMLAHFAKDLPAALFKPAAGKGPVQKDLEGVPPASETPNLTEIGLKVGKLYWSWEATGYTMEIFLGTGRAESNLLITDSILSNWRLMPKEGGSVIARFDVESADVSAEAFGKLAKLKSREIEIGLYPPEVKQQDIDLQAKRDAIPPAPARKPGPAERAAVAKVKGVDPVPPTPHKGTAKPARTARGKAQTKAALEAGAAAAAGNAEPGKPTEAWPFPNKDKASTNAAAATAAFAQQHGGKAH